MTSRSLRLRTLEDRTAPASGDLDPAFGTAGVVSLSQLTAVHETLLEDDGYLVAVGAMGGNGSYDSLANDFGIVRLRANGVPDLAFGVDGVVRVPFDRHGSATGNDTAYSVSRFADGSGYVVAGTASLPETGSYPGDYLTALAVVVLTADGKLDTRFDGDGTAVFRFDASGRSNAPTLAVLPDRSILLGGRSSGPGQTGGAGVKVIHAMPEGGWEPVGDGGTAFFPSTYEQKLVNKYGEYYQNLVSPPVFSPDGGFYLLTDQPTVHGSISFTVYRRSVILERYAPSATADGFARDANFGGTGALVLLDNVSQMGGSHGYYNYTDVFVVVGPDGWPVVALNTTSSPPASTDNSLTLAYSFFGDPDKDFASAGKSDSISLPSAGLVKRLVDGRLYEFNGAGPVRWSTTGARDTSFGTGNDVSPFPNGFIASGLGVSGSGASVAWANDSTGGLNPPLIARFLGDPPPPSAITALPRNVAASGLPDGVVRILGPRAAPLNSLAVPFTDNTNDARVAAADFDGDGVTDCVIGTGPGSRAAVHGSSGTGDGTLFQFNPFEDFSGGVYLAAGDLDGDGLPELVVTPDQGGGPRVDVYKFAGGALTKLDSFFGIDDAAFRGGARASVGDVSGDGRNDLVVAAGFGGGPRVAGFDGLSVGQSKKTKVFADYFAFEQTLRNGVFIAAGDLDGDGFAEVIAGGGPGGGPRVTAFHGKSLLENRYDLTANFFAGDDTARDGVRLSVKNFDNDPVVDLVASSGTTVRGYRGAELPRVDFTLQNTGIYVG